MSSTIMEREDQDKILDYLNSRNMPFPRYCFIQGDKYGHMMRLGSGGGGSVYAVQSRLGDELAVKIVGLQIPPITNPQVIKDCMLEVLTQREVGKTCREIVQIEDAQVLCLKLDEDCNVLAAKELTSIHPEPGCGLFLFILMEKLQPVHTSREGVISRLKSLDEDEVIKFAIDIGKALRAAHTHPKKIIHRDVKPDNIFWDKLTGVYKLGDFGIAKATQFGTDMTVDSGTGNYRAPEVRSGGSYDIRADIYSYGIMLYKLLNNDWNNRRFYDFEKPLPAPENGSDALKKIVLKACSYKPEDRYDSMDDLLWELELLQSGSGPRIPVWEKTQEDTSSATDIHLTEDNKTTAPENQNATDQDASAMLDLTQGNHSDDAFSAMRSGKPATAPSKPKAATAPSKPKAATAPSTPKAATAPSTPKASTAAPAVTAPKQNTSDDVFASMRKGIPEPPPNPKIAKKIRKRTVMAIIFGVIGLLSLLVVLLSAELIWKDSFLPDLSAWQTYVAIALSVLCTVITFSLKDTFYTPILTTFFAFIEQKPVWSLAWLLAIGFNIYCFFGLGFNWIFLVLAICLLLGSKGLLLVANIAALASIPFAASQDLLPVLPTSCYWVLLVLFVVGIKHSIILMNGYIPRDELGVFFSDLTGKANFILAYIFLAIGGIIWGLDMIPAVNLPTIISQLHVLRFAIAYFIFSVIEEVYSEILY